MERGGRQERLKLALQREASGERVIWQAERMARIDGRSFGIYVFAIPWTAFALFWTTMAAGASFATMKGIGWLGLAFPLFGLPFIAVGLAMLAAPFAGIFMGSRTLYAATERRLLKLTIGRALKVDSVPIARLGAMQRRERPDGSGSLSYPVRIGTDSDGDRTTETFAITDVADVFAASRRIEQQADALRQRLPPAVSS